ncbi:MAG: periplasmic protein TonB [Acetobacteraceae bacterium]|nr:periplasmic protein TonB [Acetobacteraceae bacterium]
MISATEPRQKLRWAAVFGLVVAAHGGLLALLGPVAKPPEPVGEPAISIDLSPAPEPEPAKDLAPPEPDPPPEAALAEPAPAQPAPAEAAPAQPPSSQPAPSDPPLPDPPLPDPPMPPLPKAVQPPVVLPRHARPIVHPKAAPPVPVARPEEPASQAQPVTPPPTSASPAVNVPSSWQTKLLAHLNRYKRYPADAQMHHRQGIAVVHFRLLPNGSAESVRLQSGSGTEALDQEAIVLIGRAAPLPAPEADTGPIDIAVPIQFTIR